MTICEYGKEFVFKKPIPENKTVDRLFGELPEDLLERSFIAMEPFDNGKQRFLVVGTKAEVALFPHELEAVQEESESNRSIHDWFELTYASYLILPRSIMQSMPQKWQAKMVALLEQLDDTLPWRREGMFVRFKDHKGDVIPNAMDRFDNYDRGRRVIEKEEAADIVAKHSALYNKGMKGSAMSDEEIAIYKNGRNYGEQHVVESVLDELAWEIEARRAELGDKEADPVFEAGILALKRAEERVKALEFDYED